MAAADQTPLGSPFGRHSEPDAVLSGIDLSGRLAIVTGGYSGIGLETVRALAGAGARLIVPARDPARAQASLAGMPGDIRVGRIDLSDIATVRAFADTVLAEETRLDLLINNAGVMACPETRIGPGWEMQFGTNHMGHFALTTRLMPLLQRTAGARVVALSSTAHKLSAMRWDDPQWQDGYDKWQAYGQSKTANALFALGLDARLRPGGGSAFAVHPGGIFTPLQRHLPTEEMIALGWLGPDGEPSEGARAMFKTPSQGATTTLWAATSPMLAGKGGVYCEDCDIAALSDPAEPVRYRFVERHAVDPDAAERLWTLSERLLEAA